jgi:hypothetical protein
MKKLALMTVLLLMLPVVVRATELSNTINREQGWVFQFTTAKINDKVFHFDLPFNKCPKTDPTKECFATKGEAEHAAWIKAAKAEKMMRAALEKKQ